MIYINHVLKIKKYYEKAKEFAIKALKSSAGMSAKAYVLLGDIETQNKQYKAAETHYLNACKGAPQYIKAYERLSELYIKTEQWKPLAGVVIKWINYSTDDAIIYPMFILYKTYQKLQNTKQADRILDWIQTVEIEKVRIDQISDK